MPTLALIKPSAVAKGYAPAIEALIEEKNFAVVARAEVRREARRSTFTGAPHTQCHPRPPQPRRRGSVKPGRSRGTRGPHMPKRQNWQVTLTVQQAADLYEEHEVVSSGDLRASMTAGLGLARTSSSHWGGSSSVSSLIKALEQTYQSLA